MYRLLPTRRFERRLGRFRRMQPALGDRVARVLRDLEADPFQPRLRLHALAGAMQGLHAVSITYEYRIILTLLIREREIVLLDIGSNVEVYS